MKKKRWQLSPNTSTLYFVLLIFWERAIKISGEYWKNHLSFERRTIEQRREQMQRDIITNHKPISHQTRSSSSFITCVEIQIKLQNTFVTSLYHLGLFFHQIKFNCNFIIASICIFQIQLHPICECYHNSYIGLEKKQYWKSHLQNSKHFCQRYQQQFWNSIAFHFNWK